MRDIAVFLIVFGLLPLVLKRPQVGIYLWSWLSYMNPHRMTWGFAVSFPFAQIVAIVTLIAVVAWKEPKRIPVTGLTCLWGFFILWMGVTTIFSYYPEFAWTKLVLVLKIQLVTVLTIILIKNKKDLDTLIWVIAMSIGFFSIKGGIFTIMTLGGFRVWGPPGSFIADNNALAVASFMIVPLMYYLYVQSDRVIVKNALLVGMLLTIISAFGSQSRGALIAAGATGAYFWWNTPHKFVVGVAVLAIFAGILGFMPDTWWDRMYTILEYEEDGSAMGRIAAWTLAFNVANAEFFGAGFDFWGAEMFRKFSDNPDHWNKNVAAHSIYFTSLGEHGWPGLMAFLLIFLTAWRTASKTARLAENIDGLIWLRDLMRVLQVSLVAYASGGAFLNLAYFDLPWHIVSMIVIGRVILESHVSETEPSSADVVRVDEGAKLRNTPGRMGTLGGRTRV